MNLSLLKQSVTPSVRCIVHPPDPVEAGVVSMAAALANRRDNNEQRSILGIPADG